MKRELAFYNFMRGISRPLYCEAAIIVPIPTVDSHFAVQSPGGHGHTVVVSAVDEMYGLAQRPID